jgi:hypothetical protein
MAEPVDGPRLGLENADLEGGEARNVAGFLSTFRLAFDVTGDDRADRGGSAVRFDRRDAADGTFRFEVA